MLKDSYFKILSQQTDGADTQFEVEMLASHPVYEGHFPGKPVSPGVCNMQMLKECAETLIGREMMLNFVKQYRMMAVMSPQATPQVQIRMNLAETEEGYTLSASVWMGEQQLIDFKGQLV